MTWTFSTIVGNLAPINKRGSMKNRTLIKLPQVIELTTLSQSTIYRLISKGVFPKQFKLAERSSAWLEQEVLDYIDGCIASR